jgi:hypothetical protein
MIYFPIDKDFDRYEGVVILLAAVRFQDQFCHECSVTIYQQNGLYPFYLDSGLNLQSLFKSVIIEKVLCFTECSYER